MNLLQSNDRGGFNILDRAEFKIDDRTDFRINASRTTRSSQNIPEEKPQQENIDGNEVNPSQENTTEPKTSQSFNNTYSLEELITQIEKNKDLFKVETEADEVETSTDTISAINAKKIIFDFARKYNCDENTAVIGITRLIQEGGANSSKPILIRTVRNIKFDIADLRSLIKFHVNGGTVRKLAKTMRNIIAHIAFINTWPGPLYKDLMRSEPTLNISVMESIYCNEIHSDNYNSLVPARIREALQRREQKFREKSQTAKNPSSKGKKKKKYS
jgi:hypothetical protein